MRAHAAARGALSAWLAEAEDANWTEPQTVKDRFATASFLPNRRVVFNIKGTTYRLDVQIDFSKKVIFIKRIGTHAEYDRWTF